MAAGESGTWKWLLVYLVFRRPADSAVVTMTSGKAVLGESGFINCSATFQAWETDRHLHISNDQLGLRFDWADVENVSSSPWGKADGRHTVGIDTSTSNMIVMSVEVKELACRDEGSYSCTAEAGDRNSSRSTEASQLFQLKLQVPQSPPSALRVTPTSTVVKENEWFDILCSVVVGAETVSSLLWRIYHGQQVQTVGGRDSRVILEEAHNLTGVDFCKQQITSKLRLPVTREDRDSHVACFVWSHEPPPAYCSHQTRDLCVQSSKLDVHYGVSQTAMRLYLFPEAAVIDGATINIVCDAEGHPAPNYTWYRSQPPWLRDKEITSRLVGNASWLSISNFQSEMDAGTYKCTAWNWVLGVELYSSSQEISVSTISAVEQQHLSLNLPALEEFDNTMLIVIGFSLSLAVALLVTILYSIVVCLLYSRCCRRKRKSARSRPAVSANKSGTNVSPEIDNTDSSVASTVSEASS